MSSLISPYSGVLYDGSLPPESLLLFYQHPGTTIVTDSVTSDGLTTFIEQKLGMSTFYCSLFYQGLMMYSFRRDRFHKCLHLDAFRFTG